MSELEIALRRPRTAEVWERIARTSLAEMQRLAGLIEALLELARAGSATRLSDARFELGEQLDQTLASLDASLQAVLAIAEQSVEAWGGTICVGDSPEGGARFTILLPASDAPG